MNKLDNPTQEQWFDIWAEEAILAGLIDEVVREPDVPTFILFKGYNRPYGKKKNVIMNPIKYTPDRIIKFNNKARNILFTPFEGPNSELDKAYFNPQKHPTENYYYSILDIKGPAGNQKAYNTDFRFTQKWLFANTGQYVQKVMLAPAKLLKNPKGYLWHDTWTPERFLYTDKLATNRNKPIPYRTLPHKKGKALWNVRMIYEKINPSS